MRPEILEILECPHCTSKLILKIGAQNKHEVRSGSQRRGEERQRPQDREHVHVDGADEAIEAVEPQARAPVDARARSSRPPAGPQLAVAVGS